MLSKTTIDQLVKRYQIEEISIIREYFQHLFLSYFYQEKGMDKVFFKGGTALRLIYRSPRFSEDLDFSANLPTIIPIENAVIETLSKLIKEGVVADIIESKPTTGGYIGIVRFGVYNLAISIHLEVSLRQNKKIGETVIVPNDYIPSYSVVRLIEKELIGEKITALLTRKKPRDFYDLYFLLRSNLIATEDKKTILLPALNLLQETNINFEAELREFLPKSHHMIIRDFRKTLEQEIKRYI